MRRSLLLLITMATTAAFLASASSIVRRQASASVMAARSTRHVMMAWSSPSFLATTTSTTVRQSSHTAIKSSSSLRMTMVKRSPMVMWGEDDSTKRQPAIPSSSKFSSDSTAGGGGRRPTRPARRGGAGTDGGGGGGGDWFDDDDDGNDESYSRQRARPPRRSGASQRSSSGWDDDAANDGDDWFSNSSGSDNGWGYEPDTRGGGGASNDNDWGSDNDSRGGGGRGYRGRSRNREESSTSFSRDRRGGSDRGSRGRSERGRGGDGMDFAREDYSSRGRGGGGRGRGNRGGGRGRDGRGRGRGRGGRGGDTRRDDSDTGGAVKINLKMIENAGYQHLYGIAPVLNALKANVRDFANPKEEDESDKDDLLELQSRLSNVDGIDDDFSLALEDEFNDNNGITSIENDDDEFGSKKKKKKIIKPEAKLSPHLFLQSGTFDNSKRSFRSNAKLEASAEILALAQEINDLPVVEVDKGVLNTLCNNRPHQGFVLRCGGLEFESVRRLPKAIVGSKNDEGGGGGLLSGPSLWLALDEVVDPQNLGALLRSAYFLGRGPGIISSGDDGDDLSDAVGRGEVGILVCSKNSSPLTPTVSAASAGALEFMTIYSTSNLPKLLNTAKEDGWRILGAAAEVPDGVARDNFTGSSSSGDYTQQKNFDGSDWDLGGEEDSDDEEDYGNDDDDVNGNEDTQLPQEKQCLELHQVDIDSPTILVLGSEGRGLRTLVARACTGFVSIPGGGGSGAVASGDDDEDDTTQAGVDSLNVSVTGGILLWHFLSKK